MKIDVEKVKAHIARKVETAMNELKDECLDEMRQKCPVSNDTDNDEHHVHMRDRLNGEVSSEGDDIGLVLRSPAPYSVYVEMGTSRMSAQPFFRPALMGFDKKLKAKLRN